MTFADLEACFDPAVVARLKAKKSDFERASASQKAEMLLEASDRPAGRELQEEEEPVYITQAQFKDICKKLKVTISLLERSIIGHPNPLDEVDVVDLGEAVESYFDDAIRKVKLMIHEPVAENRKRTKSKPTARPTLRLIGGVK